MSQARTPGEQPTWGAVDGPSTGLSTDAAAGHTGYEEALPPLRLHEGMTIGTFVVQRELGAGGNGVVVQAHDPELDRPVAIKLLHGEQQSAEAQARLQREAQAVAKLSDPNVVAVYQVGTFSGRVFVVMEYVDGGTLRQWVKGGRRPWREIVETYRHAGRGLAAAHRAGLVHRDFKPDNVLVGGKGGPLRPRVTDFGIVSASAAGAVDPHAPELTTLQAGPSTRLTRTGAVLGTPAYMAPEQWRGETVGPAADQFSFCVSLFEALYGYRPFQGATVPELLYTVTHGQLQPPPTPNPVPLPIHEAVVRGLATQPEHRHPSMQALVDALDPRRAHGRPGTGTLVAAIAGAVVMLGAMGAGAWWLLREQPDGAESATGAVASCPDPKGELHELWGAERRAHFVASTKQRTEPPLHVVVDSVAAELDTYAKEWVEHRAATCQNLDESSRTRARACLDRARDRLSVYLEMMSDDQIPLVHAHAALDGFPPVSRCDYDLVAHSDAAESLSTEGYRRLVRAKLSFGGGDLAGAEAQARSVYETGPGGDALRVAAGLTLSKALMAQGRLEDALAELNALAALEVARSDPPVWADVEQTRAVVLAYTQRSDEAERHFENAREAVSQVGDPWSRAQLQSVLGLARAAHGDLGGAREHVDEALEIYAQMTRRFSASATAILRRRAEIQRATDLAAAERDYARVIDGLVAIGGPAHPQLGSVHLELGMVLLAQQKLDQAQRQLEMALERLRVSPKQDPSLEGQALRGLGEVELAAGNRQGALARLRQAHELLAQAHGDREPLTMLTQAKLGYALYENGQFEAAVRTLESARSSVVAVLGPEERTLPELDTYLAASFSRMGDHDGAIEAMKRAIDGNKRYWGGKNAFMMASLATLGDLHEQAERCEEALEHYRAALQLRRELRLPADQSLALPHAGWAMCALAADDPDRAREHVDEAMAIVDQHEVSPPIRGRVWFAAAQLAQRDGDLERALHLGTQAKDAFDEAGPPFRGHHDEVQGWLGTIPG